MPYQSVTEKSNPIEVLTFRTIDPWVVNTFQILKNLGNRIFMAIGIEWGWGVRLLLVLNERSSSCMKKVHPCLRRAMMDLS